MANKSNPAESGRGFASMDDARQRAIASKGGKAAHESGNAHEFNTREAREAGRKGGEAVSKDRKHMSEIGREGGSNSRSGTGGSAPAESAGSHTARAEQRSGKRR